MDQQQQMNVCMDGCKEFRGDFVVVDWAVLLVMIVVCMAILRQRSPADYHLHHEQLAAATRGRSLIRPRVGI